MTINLLPRTDLTTASGASSRSSDLTPGGNTRQLHLLEGGRRPEQQESVRASGEDSRTISCGDCIRENSEACDDCVVSFLLRNDPGSAAAVGAASSSRGVRKVRFVDSELSILELLQGAGLAPELRHVERHPARAALAAQRTRG